MIKFSEDYKSSSQLLAIGIGGAGDSVIDKIGNSLDTYLIDTDTVTLDNSTAKEKLCLSAKSVRDLTGGTAGSELKNTLKSFVDSLPKAEMVFTISGLGADTGTVVTPYLVEFLREKAYWVWSLCTIPFFFEGKSKILNSLKRLKTIQQTANTVLVIPHDKIFKMADKTLSMKEAFTPANSLCAELITAISRLTCGERRDGWINIKFSDIKNRIVNKETTSFGIGEGTGEDRIRQAIEQAVSGPLLDKEVLNSSKGVILSFSGSKTLRIEEVNNGIGFLRTLAGKDIDIIFGVVKDTASKERVKAGIITTGLEMGSNMESWDLSPAGATKEVRRPIVRTPQQAQKPKQTMIDFKRTQKGRFERSEATVFGGVDLDVPTFLRKKKNI